MVYDPLAGLTAITMPNALQRTLSTALGAGATQAKRTTPDFELFLPESVTQPEVKETPVEHLRSVQAAHPVPHEWETRLRAFSPISTRVSWLAFRWADGIPDEPIGRWMLYECSPTMSDDIRSFLGGRPWWAMPEGQQAGRRQLVSAYQWEMYRKHRVWARPFWCLQGDKGGTPTVYGELEKKLLHLAGKPVDPPTYGSLPYAPFDARAEAAIREREALYTLGRKLDRLNAQGIAEHLKAESVEAERQFRIKFLAWIDEAFAPQVDFLDWYTRKTEADMVLPKATETEVTAAAKHAETFVETGLVPTH